MTRYRSLFLLLQPLNTPASFFQRQIDIFSLKSLNSVGTTFRRVIGLYT